MDILTKQNENPVRHSHCVSTEKHLPKEIEGKGVSSELESMTYFYGRCKLITGIFKTGIKT